MHRGSLLKTTSKQTFIPYGEYPSCLHTTLASLLSQKSSQMVPQVPLTHTSTLPRCSLTLPESRTSPFVQDTLNDKITSMNTLKTWNKTLQFSCCQSTFTSALGHEMLHWEIQLCTFTNDTCILEMRAAQHAVSIRVLVTCQNGRFHPTATKIGHQDGAWSLTKDSISCCNCTCGKLEVRNY